MPMTAVLAAVLVTACSPSNEKVHFLKFFNTKGSGEALKEGELEVIASDAKTRLLISTKKKDAKNIERRIICAEPSPDAFSQFSAEFAANLSVSVAGKGEGSGAVRESFEEIAKSMTERTQAIQLLRDGLYRDCEAHVNGRSGEFTYHMTLAAMPKIMNNLIVIESLGARGFVPANEDSAQAISDAATAEIELATLKDTLTARRAQHASLERELRKAQDEQNRLTGRKVAVDSQSSSLESEISTMETQRDKDFKAGKDTKKLDEDIKAAKQTKIHLDIESKDLEAQIASKTASVTALSKSVAEALSGVESAQQDLTANAGAKQALIAAGKAAQVELAPGVAAVLSQVLAGNPDADTHIILSACMMWLAANGGNGENATPPNPEFARVCQDYLRQAAEAASYQSTESVTVAENGPDQQPVRPAPAEAVTRLGLQGSHRMNH